MTEGQSNKNEGDTYTPKASLKEKAIAIISTIVYGSMALVVEVVKGNASRYSIDFSVLFGSAVASAVFAFLVVGLFQIGKRFRNQKSRYAIYTRTIWFFILGTILMLFRNYGFIE